jgi:hypothetical protein
MSNFIKDLDLWIKEAAIGKKAADEPTSHPSDSASDGNQTAETGSRASENEKDVKVEVPGQNVNEAKANEAKPAGAGENTPTNEIGTKKAPTGEAPAVETESVKSKPSDPGTAHPAKATEGEKFSSAQAVSLIDECLADIAVAAASVKSAGSTKRAEDEKEVEVEIKTENGKPKVEVEKETEKKDEEDEDKKEAMEAGKTAAQAILAQSSVSLDQVLADVVKSAEADAARVSDFYAGFLTKLAEGEDAMALAAPEAEMAGDGAGMEAGMGAGMGGAGGAGEEDIQALVEALLAAGVTPEQLMALIEGEGAAAPAEAPAEAMAEVPKAAAAKVATAESSEWSKMSMEEKKAAFAMAINKAVEGANSTQKSK